MKQESFKTIKKKIKVRGQTLTALIDIYVEEDDINPADDYASGDADQDAKYLARFKSGELFCAVITVKAVALGETGYDSLGGCHIPCNNMFNSTPFQNEVEQVVKFHDMVSTALDDLRQQIETKADQLQPYMRVAK